MLKERRPEQVQAVKQLSPEQVQYVKGYADALENVVIMNLPLLC